MTERSDETRGLCVEQGFDLRTTRIKGCDHAAGLSKLSLVAVRACDRNRTRMEKAVAMRHTTRGQSQNLGRNDLVTKQRDQCMRRADKFDRGLAIGELVFHDLGNGQSREGRFNSGLQHLG